MMIYLVLVFENNKGYDAGKKISGIKRHIVVDSQVIRHRIYITTAEKNHNIIVL